MIKVKDFDNADELEYLINNYNIKRKNIIDIKWAATSHHVYGLIIYEINENDNLDYHQENI